MSVRLLSGPGRAGLCLILLLILLPAAIRSGNAQPAETEWAMPDPAAEALDPMVVTARALPTTASLTPGGVGVILESDIQQVRPVSLTDVARFIPGVEKTSDSPWGSDINIRGLSRNSVLFLIDGCRVNTATDINARFGLINPDDIERIEVLKGPVSALYGWGAMGGVVNVITRTGAYAPLPQTHAEVRAKTGSNPEGYSIYGTGSFSDDTLWLLASGGYRDFDPRKSAGDAVLPNSQYRDVSGRLAGGYLWNQKNETKVNVQVTEGKNIGIPGKGLALNEGPDAAYPSTRRILGSLTHTLTPASGPLTQSRIRLFYQEVDRSVRLDHFPSASPTTSVEPGADHGTLGLNWTNRFSVGTHIPVVGIEVWEWRIDNTQRIKTLKSGQVGIDSSLGNLSQTVGGVFAEDTWPVSDTVILNLGGRLDATRVKSDDLYNWILPPASAVALTRVREADTAKDASFQGQIGLTWEFAESWSATAVAATSYRPPDLMDRFKYVNLGGGVSLYGNPDLDPEQSRFFEAGIHLVRRRFSVSGTLYHNRLTNMITETQVSSARIQMDNVARARIYGGELSGKCRLQKGVTLSGSLAWTRGDNRTTGEALPYIAPLNTRVTLGWDPKHDKAKGWWARLTHEWADAQDRVPGNVDPSTGWQTVDLFAGYRFRAMAMDHEVILGVTNLFDEDYKNFLATSRGMELKEAGTGFTCSYTVQF